MRNPSVLPALVLLTLVACSDSGPAAPDAVAVAQVALTSPVTEMQLGDSAGSALTDRAVTWTSGNPSVLQVGATRVVTGVGGGTASVSATVDGRTANVSLTVHSWNIADNAVVVDSTNLRLVSDSVERAAGRLRFHLEQGKG